MEIGPADEVFFDPKHPYTQMLVGSNPEPDPEFERTREHMVLKGEIPSPVNVAAGCRFAGRCPKAIEKCRATTPELTQAGEAPLAACHLLDWRQ